jgi:nucleotide-binding universal stress UspA family protein
MGIMAVVQHILVCVKPTGEARGWSAGSEAAIELASQIALADRCQVSLLTVIDGVPVSPECPGKEMPENVLAGTRPEILQNVQRLHADLATSLADSAVTLESLIAQAPAVEETLSRQIDQSTADLVIRGWTRGPLPDAVGHADETETDQPLQAQTRTQTWAQNCAQDCALWQVQPAALAQDFPCLAWLDVPGEQALRRLQWIVQLAQVTRSRLLILGPHLPEEGSEPFSEDPLLQEFQDRLRQTDFRTLDLGLRLQHLPENDPEALARTLADYQVTTLAIPVDIQACAMPTPAASCSAQAPDTAWANWQQLADEGGFSLLTLP